MNIVISTHALDRYRERCDKNGTRFIIENILRNNQWEVFQGMTARFKIGGSVWVIIEKEHEFVVATFLGSPKVASKKKSHNSYMKNKAYKAHKQELTDYDYLEEIDNYAY